MFAAHKFEPYADNGGSILAIAGEDYALIGSDTRLCRDNSICTRDQKWLFKLSQRMVFGAVGCWADGLQLQRLLSGRQQMYESETDKSMSTPAMAQMVSTVLYYKRFFPYNVSSLLAGLDEDGKGCVFHFDCLGWSERCEYCAEGSARSEMQPLLDNRIGLKNMQNVTKVPMSREKALVLLKDAFTSATERSSHTGD
ncbi:Proteasome beta subunit, partial [Operophtera brumata]